MKSQFPIENSITDLDLSSPVLDQSRPVKRFVLGSIVLHVLSASAVFMLRPLPQPVVEEPVEIQVGAGPQAPIESAPQQTEILQEAQPAIVESLPVVEKPIEKPIEKIVEKPVEKSTDAPAKIVAQQDTQTAEPTAEPTVEALPIAELDTPPVSEEPVLAMAPQPEVTSEEINEEIREQVEEKLETTPIPAVVESPAETVAPVETITPAETVAATQTTSGQGEAQQSSSPSPNQGELRSLSQLRQMPGNPKPMYEANERRLGHSGHVIFKAFVTQEGQLSNFRLIQSSGHKNLDFKTLKALKQWRFFPGQQGWVELPFKWDLKGGPQEMPTQLRRRVGQNSN
ncbi:MAG: TonB family protein [Bdellovibrionales bacterium]